MDNTNNFLNEIKRLSEEEKAQMLRELEELRQSELDKAAEKGKAEAESYVAGKLRAAEAEITGEYAVKNLEADSKLYKRRDEIIKELFAAAEKKLIEFSEKPEYKEKLLKDAREIADAFGSNYCTLNISEKDLKYSDEIKAFFNSDSIVSVDTEIQIGGIKGFCPALSIIADNTLDAKLESQKEWFIENAELRV